MRRRIAYLIITVMLMLPFFVKAATFRPSLSCPSNVSPGETISCEIKATIDDSITAIQGDFSLSGVTFVEFTSSVANSSSNEKFLVYDPNGGSLASLFKTKTPLVGTLKVKLPNSSGTFNININNIWASYDGSDGSQQKVTASNLSQTVSTKTLSTDSTLKSLSVEGMTLGPNFSTTLYDYSLPETDAASINIIAVTNDSNAKVSGAGKVTLKYGDNVLKVVVTSEAGTKTEYKIRVHKTDTRDTVNTLKSLGVKNYTITPAFSLDTKKYSLNVGSSVTKVEVTASLTSNKSSFVKGYGPRTVTLKYGNNAVNIKVKAENEKENTYVININREDNRDSNNYLSSISLSDGNINFNKTIEAYTVDVDADLKEITVSAVAESNKSKVTGSGTIALNAGKNVIEIKVTAENEVVRTYKITVNRGEAIIPEPNETIDDYSKYIQELTIKNHDIKFSSNKFTYDIEISEDEKRLEFLYKVGPEYSATLVGNDDLKDGSVITLTIDDNGYPIIYKFNIKVAKEEEKSSDNLILYIAAGLLGLVVLGMLLSIFVKDKPTPEEVVKQKFITEGPPRFVNERTLVDGLGQTQVTGSMIAQVEKPNSMSDIELPPVENTSNNVSSVPQIDEPEIEQLDFSPKVEEPAIPEPPKFEEPSPFVELPNDMEPMPIGAPVTSEVAGDFTPNPEATLKANDNNTNRQYYDMNNLDIPSFEEITDDDKFLNN